MDRIDVNATMAKLQRMDEDAVKVYQAALGKVRSADTRQRFEDYRGDHERHTYEIARFLKQQGWERTRPSAEFEEFMQALLRQVEQAGTEDEMMSAMDLGERATNAEYAEALKLDIDLRSREMLDRCFSDEQRHLAFVQSRLPVGVLAGRGVSDRGGGYGADTGGTGPMGGMGGDVGPGGGGPAGYTDAESRDLEPEGDVTTDRGAGTRAADEEPYAGPERTR